MERVYRLGMADAPLFFAPALPQSAMSCASRLIAHCAGPNASTVQGRWLRRIFTLTPSAPYPAATAVLP